MTEYRFQDSYVCLENNYGKKNLFNRQINKIAAQASLLDGQSKAEDLISVHFSKSSIGNHQHELFSNLVRFKYLNIMQPQVSYNEDNQYILVYQDYLKYQLNNQTFYQLLQQKKGIRILLQLALAFAEFEKRQYPWPLKSIEEIYYIEDLIFLSLADYDFNIQVNSCYQTFCQFVRQYFCQYFSEIEEQLQNNSFQVIINYLLEREGNMNVINHLNPPYENVLIYLLQIKKLNSIYNVGNSTVKSFDTPRIFKQLFVKLKESIVYKSTKFQSDDVKEQILNNMKREIELMEKFNDQSYMAVCFSYFRIGDYSFLLQKKYVGTLANALSIWKPISQQQQVKDVYTFSQRFALALREMHKFNIIHRDLKPENLFFDSLELTTSWVYIADFDRSKQLKDNQTQNSVLTTMNGNCTPKYDPPEERQTLAYDVFQYGLIVLTVANLGRYIGHDGGGPRMMQPEQFQSFYGPNAIRSHLQKYNYKEEFLQIIIRCLNIDPQNRPNAIEIYQVMNKLSINSKIILVSSNSSESSSSPVKRNSISSLDQPLTPQIPQRFSTGPELETSYGQIIKINNQQQQYQQQQQQQQQQLYQQYPQQQQPYQQQQYSQQTPIPPRFTPNIQIQTSNGIPQWQQQQQQQQQPQQMPQIKLDSNQFETPGFERPLIRQQTYPQTQDSINSKIKIISISQNTNQTYYPPS